MVCIAPITFSIPEDVKLEPCNSSELHSQACLGKSSTTMGGRLGSPRVAPPLGHLSKKMSNWSLILNSCYHYFYSLISKSNL